MVNIAQRITSVENSLLPPVIIQGEPAPEMTLAVRMQHYKVPGVSIAVIDNGEIEWARGYGVCDQDNNIPVTTTTLFQAASISKPVAAMAALSLVQEGKLDLDEDVNNRLKSWKVPENEYTTEQKVTLRGLLSHTAGVTVHGFEGYSANQSIPNLLQVLDGVEPANSDPIRVDLKPRSQWRYSGGGYTIMQQLLIDVVGKPFPVIAEELVLNKIGMKYSTFEQPLPEKLVASAATAHQEGQKLNNKWHNYPEMAAAGLWTTPSDLALFAIELQNALSGSSNKILSTEMANVMITPEMHPYGLGLMLNDREKVTRFGHGGANTGFMSKLVSYTSKGQGAVVMTNGSDGYYLAEEIIRSIAKEYNWIDFLGKAKVLAQVNPQIYDIYSGEYELKPNFILKVTKNQDRLYTQATDQQKLEMFPESETNFFCKEVEAQITFVKNKTGQVTHLVLNQQGEYVAKKLQ